MIIASLYRKHSVAPFFAGKRRRYYHRNRLMQRNCRLRNMRRLSQVADWKSLRVSFADARPEHRKNRDTRGYEETGNQDFYREGYTSLHKIDAKKNEKKISRIALVTLFRFRSHHILMSAEILVFPLVGFLGHPRRTRSGSGSFASSEYREWDPVYVTSMCRFTLSPIPICRFFIS
jgi:hypothetical protein